VARTIRTCSLGLLVALAGATPGLASTSTFRPTGASTFVGARAAELQGDPRRAALLYAALSAADPANSIVANRAISQAISAGDMPLALRLASARPPANLALDARLLLAADRLRSRRPEQAIALLNMPSDSGSLSFLTQPVQAWAAAERRDPAAVNILSSIPAGSVSSPIVPELRALTLLRLGRGAEAEPFARQAVAQAGGRAIPLRIALADGYVQLRDQRRALAFLDGSDPTTLRARALVQAGKRPGGAIETAAQGFAVLLTALALDLNRENGQTLPIAMAQVARYADPANEPARLLLGLLLGQADRTDDALVALRGIDERSLFAPQVRDAETRALVDAGRQQEALARAQAFAQGPGATAADWGRLGDMLDELDRNPEAAAAYGRAIALQPADAADRWQFYLLYGAMLDRAKQWDGARAALETARRLAPQNATVLNYLGYAQLERGENLDAAEALIAQAHRLKPDDGSITDSLGWAQFKRGRLDQAIAFLTQAAAGQPAEAEIHEHLGDALYSSGRKFEARHAWNAALITAEDEARTRIQSKLQAGLNPGNAAP